MDCFVKIFGCSHSAHGPFYNTNSLVSFFKSNGYEKVYVKNMALSGNANDKIIDDVYRSAESETGENVFYIIQYSYLNRLWLPNDMDMIFHSFLLDETTGEWPPHIPSEKKKYLKNMYESFVTCFYDDELYFKDLIKKIDFLKAYLDNKGIKFIHFLWESLSNKEELVETKKEFHNLYINDKIESGYIDKKYFNKLRKLDLIEFEQNIFNFSRISFDKKITNWHTFGGGNYDLHLTENGNQYLAAVLLNKLYEKIQ